MKYSIVILAGGTSRRMGRDKALLPYKSSTLLNHLASFCKGISDDVIICSDNPLHHIDGTRRIGDFKKNIGPLGGVIPAFEESKYDWIVTTSCDMPNLNMLFIETLIKHSSTSLNKPIIPIYQDQPQYLCALYHVSILKTWKDQISLNNYSIKHNLNDANCNFVDMDFLEEKTFRNINTFEEYQSILK